MREAFISTMLLWLAIAMPAHAQQSPMVQCRIGSCVQVMLDFACDARVRGAAKMSPETSYAGKQSTIKECAVEMAKYSNATWPQMSGPCMEVYRAMATDEAMCRYRGNR